MPDVEKKPDTTPEPIVPADNLEAPEIDEAPLLEPPVGEPANQSAPHPLAPGGRRFEQVYAEAKQAQRDSQVLKERLAAAEARLDMLTKPAQADENKEYSWAELETFIQQGRITRADAEAHREEVVTRKLAGKIKGDFTNETREATRQEVLTRTVQDYVAAIPAIAVEGSAERIRLDEEFDFVASIQGLDPAKLTDTQRRAFQVSALRNVYGPVDSLRKRSAPAKVEPNQGLPGGNRPDVTPNKDQALLDGLSKNQVVHYRKMMAAGRYKGGWKDVVAELKYEKPKAGSR